MNESDSRAGYAPPRDEAHISGAINKILEHPELIGMIGSMLKSPPPSVEVGAELPAGEISTPTEAAPSAAAGGTDILATLAPMLSRLQGSAGGSSRKDDKRECLLIALKPYLSKERCEAIDQMLKISRISDIFKNMS